MDIGAVKNVASNVPGATGTVGRQTYTATSSTSANQTAPVQTQTSSAVQQATQTPSLDQVKQAIQELNRSMRSLSRGLEFSIDEDSDRTIVKVVDQQTGDVIRQIPSEETLAIAKSIDQVVGKLIKHEV